MEETKEIIMKCQKCNGDGYTAEHDTSAGCHDEEGMCTGRCPIQVQCEECRGTGEIKE